MEDTIEVEIALLRGGMLSFDTPVLGRMRLTPLRGGGHRIYVHSGEHATFWESRGFLAARTEKRLASDRKGGSVGRRRNGRSDRERSQLQKIRWSAPRRPSDSREVS
jgi:hypothetical protein